MQHGTNLLDGNRKTDPVSFPSEFKKHTMVYIYFAINKTYRLLSSISVVPGHFSLERKEAGVGTVEGDGDTLSHISET